MWNIWILQLQFNLKAIPHKSVLKNFLLVGGDICWPNSQAFGTLKHILLCLVWIPALLLLTSGKAFLFLHRPSLELHLCAGRYGWVDF